MRIIALMFFLVLVYKFGSAQNRYHDTIEPRLTFSTDKKPSLASGEIIVLGKDTLFAHFDKDLDLSNFNLLIEDEKFYNYYRWVVLRYANDRYLHQWTVPIKIYMGEEFPKSIAEKFKAFYSQIEGIKNLNISFVNKIKNANYHIKLTEADINAYDENFEFDSDAERKNFIYTGCTYKLNTDKNFKFYGGTLTMNSKRLQNENRALNQLKQLFFLSLGNFILTTSSRSENSLINKNYIPQDSISELDLKLLRIHYHILYEQPVNKRTFSQLMKFRKDKK